MASFKEINGQISGALSAFNQKFNNMFSFLYQKIKNFRDLTLGEKISYSTMGIGLLLILISLVMFML
ncbi:MAG: hypothetical protein AB1668_07235 [Nanoarchaeota archaeon]